MGNALSAPIEELIGAAHAGTEVDACDVVVIGSGYGGAFAALRLAGAYATASTAPLDVVMLERGNEYALGDFPESIGELPGHIRFQRGGGEAATGYAHGLFDFRVGDPVSIVVGNGLGGTSLINANVALEPEASVFADSAWPSELRDKGELAVHFSEVRRLLGVKDADVEGSKKFEALKRVAGALNEDCKPAPIAVTQTQGPNAVGVMQQACIKCGNCVSGCNYAAKNTLAMNVLPLALERGARIYTGATVLTVEPDAGATDGSAGWNVRFQRTATAKGVLAEETYVLHAARVILAAGTLGSTEILLRSQAAGKVELSDQLGKRFSTNGDAIAFGYGQENEVNAVAHADFSAEPEPVAERNIGPTISGYFQATAPLKEPDQKNFRVTVQDAAVPSAVALVFGEILATTALPRRLVSAGLLEPLAPAWFQAPSNRGKDPLAVHPGAMRHSQVLLAMGNDGAPGSLRLAYPDTSPSCHDLAGVEVVWTSRADSDGGARDENPWDSVASQSVFAAIDKLFDDAEGRGGFDKGDYLASPAWRFLPLDMGRLGNNAPMAGHKLVSVHPLGGCPMADCRDAGVVNHAGEVFNAKVAATKETYKGLYVLDASIMPSALGANPFLTIAALAHRNAGLILERGMVESRIDRVTDPRSEPSRSRIDVPLRAHHVSARFTEQLMGKLDRVPRWLRQCIAEDKSSFADLLVDERGLAVRIEIELADIHEFLRNTREPLNAHCCIYANEAPTDTIPSPHLSDSLLLAEGWGTVEIMAWDRPGNLAEEWRRALLAVLTFLKRRGIRDIAELAVQAMDPRDDDERMQAGDRERLPRATDDRTLDLLELINMVAGIARHHAQWRQLRYSFNLAGLRGAFTLDGVKELAYAPDKLNPWTALIELPIELRDSAGRGSVHGTLCVDLVDLSKRPALQITEAPDTPVALGALASFGLLCARALFQTHLATFRIPTYREVDTGRDARPDRLLLSNGGRISPTECKVLPVPPSAKDPSKGFIHVRLTRYEPPKATRGTILLVHGFAHGSRLFTTDTISVSFASHLYEAGYDVWLLDHRLSNMLRDCRDQTRIKWLDELPATIDEVAEHDISTAVDHVYRATGAPIQLFAHCVGAAAVSMSILSGNCHDREYEPPTRSGRGCSKIASLALHAVPPWLVASVPNRLRANLAAFLKDALRMEYVDPIPSRKPTAREKLVDALCSSIPWPSSADEDRHNSDSDDLHYAREICARYNVIYGLEWNHRNLAAATHEQLHRLVGIGNIETFRQIFFMSLRQRITTRDGTNRYLDKDLIEQFWRFPTLFAHGSDNGVFNPLSSVRSFIRLSLLRSIPVPGPVENIKHRAPKDVFLFECPGMGHLDFLFGKDARRKVYPYLDGFFRIAAASARGGRPDVEPRIEQELYRQCAHLPFERDPHWRAPSHPECGPIIGWSRRVGTKVVLRLWTEALDDTTAPPRRLDFGKRPSADVTRIKLARNPSSYPGSYFIYDVSVPPGAKEVDFCIDYEGNGILRTVFEQFEQSIQHLSGKSALEANHAAGDAPQVRKRLQVPLAGLPWFDRLSRPATGDGVAFLVGSCRYPGSPFEREEADRIFKPMLDHIRAPDAATRPGVDHVLFVGDQIYADATADLFDTREPRERFSGRYREAFQSKNLKALLATVPCAMAVDDHEIADNWPGLDGAKPPSELIESAVIAAEAYQWGLSSRADAQNRSGLWHDFVSGEIPFFVLDTRTGRELRRSDKLDSARLIHEAQQQALFDWLNKNGGHGTPLFVVSGSPIAPVLRQEQDATSGLRRDSEGWIGYPSTLNAVMRHIAKEGITNVVFVSGDPHFSATSRLDIKVEGRCARVFQIVSSGFYAPLPFANARHCDYVWNTPVGLDIGGMHIEATSTYLTGAKQQFMRVDVMPAERSWQVRVRVYGVDGAAYADARLF